MTAEEFAAMERRARMFEAANEKMLADNKRLREENARLREALKPFAEAFESDYAEQEEDHWDLWESAAASILTYGHLRAAKAAILGKVKAEAACPEPDEAP